MYINPLRMTLGRYPVTTELNPGLQQDRCVKLKEIWWTLDETIKEL